MRDVGALGGQCDLVADPAARRRVHAEETSWAARPELAPDGKRLLYSGYRGRQWHQLWLTTPNGAAPTSIGSESRAPASSGGSSCDMLAPQPKVGRIVGRRQRRRLERSCAG